MASTRVSRPLVLAAWFGMVCCQVWAQADVNAVALSGSYKNLAVQSRTMDGEPFDLDLQRIRLKAQGRVSKAIEVDVQYDNELLVGSYLGTSQFALEKDLPSRQYWRADANYMERGDVYGRHRLHRASITASAGDLDLKVGRQRIAWGTGRFFSPLDLLNPVSPIAIEREERLGVDAALLEAKFSPVSRLSLVVAPRRGAPADRAVQWHGNARGMDHSFVVARVREHDMAGIDAAGRLGAAGIRGEFARFRPSRSGASSSRAMVGADYGFVNSLTVSAELYYNAAGARDRGQYDFSALLTGQTLTLARRYLGLFASYDLTPLLKWTTQLVVNADDNSRALDTRLVWSVQTDLELSAGVQRLTGSSRSEYGRLPNAALIQLLWFF
jgi:hypothetical protein